jgi:soluble lytic murein transglycosylase-like protein
MKSTKFCLSLTSAAAFAVIGCANAFAGTDARALGTIVEQHAKANGIPVQFARAIVKVESNWNPRLTGAAGEVGLMQIKHDTARHLGYDGSREALYDPDVNVRWGMRYLAGAWKLADGDHCGTVLRYQAGHQARSMTDAARAYCARLRKAMVSLD